jgi:hypothetical protein
MLDIVKSLDSADAPAIFRVLQRHEPHRDRLNPDRLSALIKILNLTEDNKNPAPAPEALITARTCQADLPHPVVMQSLHLISNFIFISGIIHG